MDKSGSSIGDRVFVYLFYFSLVKDEPVQEVVYEQKMAEPGEKIRFMLPDVTLVHLNFESSVEYPRSFYSDSQGVYLEGEAYFIVEHDMSHPFSMQTEDVTTRVLGTSFNKRSSPDDEQARVAIVSGKVAVLNQVTSDS